MVVSSLLSWTAILTAAAMGRLVSKVQVAAIIALLLSSRDNKAQVA